MSRAYLSMGSNMGDREGFLNQALRKLCEDREIRIEAVSSIFETDPVGFTEQPDFLNIAVRIRTDKTPEDLLSLIQGIERDLGRVRERRYGPRTIDIDILLFENQERKTERLTIPHPRMLERAFVLIPLCEVMRDLSAPIPAESGVRYYGETQTIPDVDPSDDIEMLGKTPS